MSSLCRFGDIFVEKIVKRIPAALVPAVCDLIVQREGYYPNVAKQRYPLMRVPKYLIPQVDRLIAEFQVEQTKMRLAQQEKRLQTLLEI